MTAWTDHVKKWASDHSVSYKVASSDPECKKAYKSKESRSLIPEKQTNISMAIIDKPSDDIKKKLKNVAKMGIEDIKQAMIRQAEGLVQPIQSADTAQVRPRGRPKKYANAKEANEAKKMKTIEAKKKRVGKGQSSSKVAPDPLAHYEIEGLKKLKAEAQRKAKEEMDAFIAKQNQEIKEARSERVERTKMSEEEKLAKKMAVQEAKQKAKLALAEQKRRHQEELKASRSRKPTRVNSIVSVSSSDSESAEGGALKPQYKGTVFNDYNNMVNHLISHITDPEEPVDPRDYNQVIDLIRTIRKMKGGAELYSQEVGGAELYSQEFGSGRSKEDNRKTYMKAWRARNKDRVREFNARQKEQREREKALREERARAYVAEQELAEAKQLENLHTAHRIWESIYVRPYTDDEIEEAKVVLSAPDNYFSGDAENARQSARDRILGHQTYIIRNKLPAGIVDALADQFADESEGENDEEADPLILEALGSIFGNDNQQQGAGFLDFLKHVGHTVGSKHPASKFGLNPFDLGEKLGEEVIAPALMKSKIGNPKTGIFTKHYWSKK